MSSEPIAIVGSACRFPGSASSPTRLWDLLKNPRDVVREFSADRLNLSKFSSQDGDQPGRTDVQNRSYLLEEDCRLFDAAFFRINAKEASCMDPQQRILLETVYEAFEAAGWPLDKMEGSSTSVHVGVMTSDYNDIQMRDPERFPTHTATGIARSILANRISYVFDLKGPSLVIDTACSSSLVALHQAVQSLRNGEVAQAIVAGAALLLDPAMYIAESKLHMLSPDSRSRMWDRDANGYARGEGCAAILLKPLSQAIRDGDDIECIVRETGMNSDGRTNGITMPSASAQADLIRQTYKRAGLDPTADMCQYFECHGTGTQAGDPVEANAIQQAFFGAELRSEEKETPLYCGSVKTVIGHLEGCAGLAGVLKASLAIQNRAIPPNMHFHHLNPAVEPYYNNLCVPDSIIPWPVTHDKPPRASVNSFGFGGTNAHAILESYEAPRREARTLAQTTQEVDLRLKCPRSFVFSARTRSSLLTSLKQISEYIHHTPSLDLDNLSWQLQSKRTVFPQRIAITVWDRQQLLETLEKHISTATSSNDSQLGFRAFPGQSNKILGVFTGQGAQWASMGRELMKQCSIFRDCLLECERELKSLPDGPSWLLTDELIAEESCSRISQPEFSQPLCTAIQIALVDLLRAVGIHLNVVVGHSSGEIAAAYAAGILRARDAIGIAYYRGQVAHMAKGSAGQKGAMMAAGMSLDDANALCSRFEFAGRLSVAASNSPSSVTVSGDMDAVLEAKDVLDEEKIFARLLKVNVAYHSHHMRPCAQAYMQYLQRLDIKPQSPRGDCVWYSSVPGYTDLPQSTSLEDLTASYWVANMVRRVVFYQALDSALKGSSSFTVAVEVGPHPALKGPTLQTIKQFSDFTIPYSGCLDRQKKDVESIFVVLGFLWSHLGYPVIDFDSWRRAFDLPSEHQLIKGLPSYAWDHDQVYWHESRLSRQYRLHEECSHELLGQLREDDQYQMEWRNLFRLKDLPWMEGHIFQGQVLFPGAGYVSMAVEAAKLFVRDRPMKMIQIEDMHISNALVIDEHSSGVETLFTLTSLQSRRSVADQNVVEAEFSCSICSDGNIVDRSCHGRLVIHLGQAADGNFPPNPICEDELPALDVDRFFKALLDLGIHYDGVFRTLKSINRIWGISKASASWTNGQLDRSYVLHPALLDVGFQVGFATFASVAEKAIGTTYLPHEVRRITIDPSQTYLRPSGETSIGIQAHLVGSVGKLVEVDINVHETLSNAPGIQVEGLVLKAIAAPQPSDDRLLFAKTIWDVDVTSSLSTPPETVAQALQHSSSELELIDAIERTALFYMQELYRVIPLEELAEFKWYHQSYFHAIESLLQPVRQGFHPVLKKEWLSDTRETIDELGSSFPDSIDIALLRAVGENLPSVMRGQSEMLEHMLKDNLLSRLYVEGRGYSTCNDNAAELVRKIVHKYPGCNILETGAGTGGTTGSVLGAIGEAYASYTYTDISAGFFERAAPRFSDHLHKMTFKTLNVETAPTDQGFVEGSFDIIIAANVLHATRNLSQTMRHVRSLLRPGGYLVAVEVTGSMLRETGLMGGLEGWWLGAEDDRCLGPGIPVSGWDQLLRESGFSGTSSILYDFPDVSRHSCSVFVSQAVDERLVLLRDPLESVQLIPTSPVLIVGGQTPAVSKLVHRAEQLLETWTSNVKTCVSIDDIDLSELEAGGAVLCLTELDRAIFSESITAKRLENLQELFGTAGSILWVTGGRLANDPYSNMMTGIGRSLALEMPHVQMQFLDFDQPSSWDMEIAVCSLLRLVLLSSSQYASHGMLWTHEPEVEVQSGIVSIPRLVRDDASNELLNARRRKILKPASEVSRIQAVRDQGSVSLVESSLYAAAIPKHSVEVDIEFSVSLHSGHESACYLSSGLMRRTGKPVLTLMDTDSSTAIVRKDSVYESKMSSADYDAKAVVAVGAALIASHILSSSPTRGAILIHGAPDNVADAILQVSATTRHRVLVISTTPQAGQQGWTYIHPLANARTIRQSIPRDAAIMWRLSDSNVENILSCLPKACQVQKFDPSTLLSMPQQHVMLCEANQNATLNLPNSVQSAPSILHISEVASGLPVSRERLSTVLEWKPRSQDFSVIAPPIDVSRVFPADKTYFLVGMASELGQSLCRFMVDLGARNIVLAGRNPIQDAHWAASMRSTGVDLRIVKMDVTDRTQVRETASMIRDTMPDIGGVANAALVLEDSLFATTTVRAIEKQLKPKVDGTIYLDEEFTHDNLDFFVAFSSLGSEYGNPGQSIYHAANMFMTSIVAKRRGRGQAASVIHIGMIADVGYVARSQRTDANIEQYLQSQYYTALAETEFHHLFVQAIVSGRPDSLNGELTMGIEKYVDDPNSTTPRPSWYNNARFSHMITPFISAEAGETKAGTSVQQLQARLVKATSAMEAGALFQELFCKRLELMMRVPSASIDVNAPLFELGLDSLLAVEIRAWLLKCIGVDIPVLAIFRQESVFSVSSKVALLYNSEGEQVATQENQATLEEEQATPEVVPQMCPPTRPSTPQHEHQPMATPSVMSDSNDSYFSLAISTEGSQADKDSCAIPLPSKPTTVCSESAVNTRVGIPKHEPLTPMSLPPALSGLSSNHDDSGFEWAPEYLLTGSISFSQASLHFLDRFLHDSTALNVTAQCDIKGPLNISRFARALDKTVARHQAFQTCFFTEPGSTEVHQGIVAHRKNGHYFTHINSSNDDDVETAFRMLDEKPWDLPNGHTFQCVLITRTPDFHTVIFACHHIIVDGFSWHVFSRDLDQAYQLCPFEPMAKSYLDFSHQQISTLKSGGLNEALGYWVGKLSPPPSVITLLPFAQTRSRQPQHTYKNHTFQREVSSNTVRRVKDASQACQATPMQFYLAAVQALFARLVSLEEICIGVTEAGRGNDDSFSNVVGHFTNVLPMRFRIDKKKSFAGLLAETSRTFLNGLAHAGVPLDVILQRLGIQRSSAYTALFQIAFNYRIGDMLHKRLGNCTIDLARFRDAETPHDFTFNITQTSQGVHLVEVRSSAHLYSAAATEMVIDAYLDVLEEFSVDQGRSPQDCNYRPEQAEQALDLGRGSRISQHGWPKTLIERFYHVCSEFPHSVAIKDDQESATYEQLASWVGGIAQVLSRSVTPGASVAVLCEPSIDTYAAMLAILHIGAVYVPLDVSLPTARHKSIVEAAKLQLLVYHDRTSIAASQCSKDCVTMSQLDLSVLSRMGATPPPALFTDQAFLLFTSGSTGTPKGIKLKQSGIMNYTTAKKSTLNLGQVKVLQQSSAGFDMSLAQAFNAFVNGGTLVVAPSQSRGDPAMIGDLILRESIELTLCTPSEYNMLANFAADTLKQCVSWRHACSGGEAISDGLVSALQRLELPNLALLDCYGPTEISCAVTFRPILLQAGMEGGIVLPHSVGKAIPNASVYIVDTNNRAVPAGFSGEICVGGVGVASGYLDGKLNSAKFVRDPFATREDISSGWNVMYKTGDKGCLREDGSLVFLGRMDGGDSLVKLRGLRIELEEVAGAILHAGQGSLVDAVVTVRGQLLVAHVLGSARQPPSQADMDRLRADLPLPRYMIPSIIVPVDSLPYTPTGKLDRKAVATLPLSIPDDSGRNGFDREPVTLAEGELRWIWEDILGDIAGDASVYIGPSTDFFAVGGSSLSLVHLQNAVKEKIGVRIELHELYRASTLSKMAAIVSREREHVADESIDWVAETSLPDHILQSATDDSPVSSPPKATNREVVLTGSTSFLGLEILAALIAHPDVAKIHCIAVPTNERHKIPKDIKASIYTGNLSSSTLGLSKREVEALQRSADQIIHAGAQGHCLNNYFSLRQANFLSTRFLAAAVALPRRVPFHYVSSPRVSLLSGRTAAPPASQAARLPPADGSIGFMSTKWASERFLESLARETGLPVTVHRPCSPVGAAAPPDDAINSVIRYSVLSRSVPRLPGAVGFFDFDDVGTVAAGIVGAAVVPGADDGNVCFRHQSCGVPVPCDGLAGRLETLYGGAFATVSLGEWTASARELGIEELIVIYLEARVAEGVVMPFPYMGTLVEKLSE